MEIGFQQVRPFCLPSPFMSLSMMYVIPASASSPVPLIWEAGRANPYSPRSRSSNVYARRVPRL